MIADKPEMGGMGWRISSTAGRICEWIDKQGNRMGWVGKEGRNRTSVIGMLDFIAG